MLREWLAITAICTAGCATVEPGRAPRIGRHALSVGTSHAERHYAQEMGGSATLEPIPAGLTSPPAPRPAVRRLATRTLARRVNLLEPLAVTADDRGFVVRFAERGREGREIVVDALTLRTTASEPYAYDEAPHAAPYLNASSVHLDMAGARVRVWNDETTGQVMVESDGRARALVSSEAAVVVGSPVAATDGRRGVVAFFASDGDAFSLVAVSVEP